MAHHALRTLTAVLAVAALATPLRASADRAGAASDGGPTFASADEAAIALKSDSPAVQTSAARWLAGRPADAAAQAGALIGLLDGASLEHEMGMHVVRQMPATAAAALRSAMRGRQGDDAAAAAVVDALVKGFDHDNATRRANILWLLTGRPEPAAFELFVKAGADKAAAVRRAAAYGLGRHNTPDAVKALKPLLADADATVRAMAAFSLGFAAGNDPPERPLPPRVTPGKGPAGRAGRRNTGTVGKAAPDHPIPNYLQADIVRALGGLLKDPETSVRNAAADALGRLRNANALPDLMAAVDDPGVRLSAVQALGEIGNPQATPAVLRALADENSTTRALTCQALGKLADVRATVPLVKVLSEDADSTVRMNAAAALGPVGDRRATPALFKALKSEGALDEHTRSAAARSLGQIADPAAVDGLIAALNDTAAAQNAAWALGQLADPKAIDPLAALLFAPDRDPRHHAREAAAEALARIKHPSAVARLVEGLLSVKTSSEATNPARHVVGDVLGAGFADDPRRLAEWWKEHAGEYRTGGDEGKR